MGRGKEAEMTVLSTDGTPVGVHSLVHSVVSAWRNRPRSYRKLRSQDTMGSAGGREEGDGEWEAGEGFWISDIAHF